MRIDLVQREQATHESRFGPLQEADRIQWDYVERVPRPMQAGEGEAYRRLEDSVAAEPTMEVTVTGPLTQAESECELEVSSSDDPFYRPSGG